MRQKYDQNSKKMIDKIKWTISPFSELSTTQLYDILHLRNKVFAVEQNDVYLDIDYKDLTAFHFMGVVDEQLVAYCRMFVSSVDGEYATIGRVVVDTEFRKYGFGRLLMLEALNVINQRIVNATVFISAQVYLKEFYESLGFIAQGEPYMDGSIEHIDMVRQ